MFKLRPYQTRAHELTIKHLADHRASRPIVSAACGAGKSVLIAKLAEHFIETTSGAVVILSSRKEILEQNASKLPGHLVGLFSAGLRKRQLDRRITIASVQSLRGHAKRLPKVSAIIIDECHVFGEAYKTLVDQIVERNPQARVIGYTGTPYLGDANRTHLWMVPDKQRVFTGVCSEISVGELLRDGYLCPLKPYRTEHRLSTEGVNIDNRTGDFQQNQLQAAVDTDDTNDAVIREMIDIVRWDNRCHTLVFCTGVEHARHICEGLKRKGQSAAMIHGGTPSTERADLIASFKRGDLSWLVSVETMTTGFDAPIADSLVFLRPTFSAVLYLQIIGRVMRLHPSKTDSLVIDFTNNTTETFPPVDEIEGNAPKLKSGEAPTKICEECFSIVLAGLKICPTCGFEFQFQQREDGMQFDSNTGLLVSGVIKNEDGSRTYPVERVEYETTVTSKGHPALIARYHSPGRASPVASTYYNLWHHSAAVVRRDSEMWLRRQKYPGGSVPLSAQEALARAEMGALKVPSTVTVRPGSPWPVRFGPAKP